MAEIYASLRAFARDEGGARSDENLLAFLRGEGAPLRHALSIKLANGPDRAWRTITGFLRGRIDQLEVRPARQKLSIQERDKQYRFALYTCFNVFREVREGTLDDRRAWLAKHPDRRLKIAVTACQKDLDHACKQIAEWLGARDISTEPKQAAAESKEVSRARAPETTQSKPTHPTREFAYEATPGLIARTSYVDQIRNLAILGQPVFLWGEAGTGKSTLALETARAVSLGSPIALLRASDPKVLEDDVLDALLIEGIELAGLSGGAYRAKLRNVLKGSVSFGCVVVDGLEDHAELGSLLPDRPSAPVLVTTRTRPRQEHTKELQITSFTDAESHAFIAQRLRDDKIRHRDALIQVLGGRPLALDHVTRYLAESNTLSLPEVVQALTEHVSSNLDLMALGCGESESIPRLYELVVEALSREPAALDALDLFLGHTGLSGMVDSSYLEFMAKMLHPDPSQQVRYAAGQLVLKRYGLVRQEGELLVIHPLTWAVLRELRGEAPTRIERRLIELFLAEKVAQHTTVEDRGWVHARLRQIEAAAGRDLLPGWKRLLVIDRMTWLAIFEPPSDSGSQQELMLRFEIVPSGIYVLDYTMGVKRPASEEEVVHFLFAMRLFNVAMDAMTLQVTETRLKGANINLLPSFFGVCDNSLLIELAHHDETVTGDRRAYHLAVVDRSHGLDDPKSDEAWDSLWAIYRGFKRSELLKNLDSIRFAELVTLVRWLIDDGYNLYALRVLSEYARLYPPASGYENSEIMLLAAQASLQIGDMTNVAEYGKNSNMHAWAERDTRYRMIGLIRAYSFTLKARLLRGAQPSQIAAIQARLQHIWTERPIEFLNDATEARYFHAMSKAYCARVLACRFGGMTDDGLENVDEKRILASARVGLEKALVTAITGFRSRAEREEIRYDRDLCKWLAGEITTEALAGTFEDVEVYPGRRDPLTTVSWHGGIRPRDVFHLESYSRRMLLVYKTMLWEGPDSHSGLDFSDLYCCEKLSDTFATFLSSYWYAETLSVLCVLAAYLCLPVEKYASAAKESYEYIGRSDRWERLVELLAADVGDRVDFAKKFSYFLTW